MNNPFVQLGVPMNAEIAEIRHAYRSLARLWHPDLYPDGPERDAAEQRMVEINQAYAECLGKRMNSTAGHSESNEREWLDDAHKLIDLGHLDQARRVLARIDTRTAEWNYLFGMIMLNRGEYDKAERYLSVAVHQAPENTTYQFARNLAQSLRKPRAVHAFSKTVHSLQQLIAKRSIN